MSLGYGVTVVLKKPDKETRMRFQQEKDEVSRFPRNTGWFSHSPWRKHTTRLDEVAILRCDKQRLWLCGKPAASDECGRYVCSEPRALSLFVEDVKTTAVEDKAERAIG